METNVKRIGIVGSHSCGKTSLLHELSKQLPKYPVVEEVASLFPRTVRSYMETQCAIMRMQIESEKRCKPLMISDRTVMDNSAYARLCYDESPKNEENNILMDLNLKRYRDHMNRHPYDLIIFVEELLPIEDNNSRCLNPYYQRLIYDSLETILAVAYDIYEDFDILYVKGSMEERMEKIKSYMSTH
jgi:nicotinamide riboside kinase